MTQDDMRKFMGNPPRNVYEAISFDAKNGARTARGQGNMSSWPIRNPITRVVLLKLANVSQEDSLRREINGASQDLERLRETRGNLQNRRDAARKHLGEIKRKFEKSQDQLVRLQKRYDSNRRLKRELTTKLAEIDQEIARSGRDRDGDSAEVKELKKQLQVLEFH